MGIRKIILGAGMLGLVGISAVALPKDNPYTPLRVISMCITRAECETPLTEIPTITEGYGKAMYQGLLGNRSDSEKELLDLINSKRKEAGACPLEYDPVLTKVAEIRADELAIKIKEDTLSQYVTLETGVGTAGENICIYDRPPHGNVSDIVNTFMSSQKTRNNMLSINFCRIGIADIVIGPESDTARYTAVIFSD